jgi:hypothetical protein
MSVNTTELFDLHFKWFKANADGDDVGAKAAFDALAQHGLHPEEFNMSPAVLEKEVVKVEQLRLDYQYHLSQISNYTLIGPKIPGGLSETSASLLRGSKGRGRKGQPGGNKSTENDLSNNEEVKEAARTFNQIDLVVAGGIVMVGKRQWTKIDESKTDPRFLDQLNGEECRVTNQFSSNVSSIQPLEWVKDGSGKFLCPIPGDIAKTVSTSSYDWEDKDATKNELLEAGLWDIAKTPKGNLRGPASLREALESNGTGSGDDWILDRMKKQEGQRPHGIDVQHMVLKVWNNVIYGWDRMRMAWVKTKPWPWHGYKSVGIPSDGLYIQLTTSKKSQVKSTDATHFRICMERAHFNLGNKYNAEFRAMTESGINFVSRHLDAAGRPAIAFCHLKLDSAGARQLVELQTKSEDVKYQWQPYLFSDNTRTELHTGDKSLKEMGARILLYLVETQPGKIEVVYSALNEGEPSGELLSEPHIEKMLCEVEPDIRFPLRHHLPIRFTNGTEFAYEDANHRKVVLLRHCKTMAKYYRDSREWTDLTNTARSVLCGKDGEQLSALFSGLRGDRSMARGDDLVETDGEPSEVKHISGAKGDAAFTIDPSGTIHLGGPGDITSQKRLFVSWMEDRGKVGASKLHMKVLVTDKQLKKLLDAQHDVYYGDKHVDKRDERGKDASAEYRDDLQYHSQSYETSKIGKGKRKDMPENGVLDFSKHIVFEFIEGQENFIRYDSRFVTFQ